MHVYRRSSRGFTLIELMMVVAILSILATVAIGSFMSYVRSSYRTEVISDLSHLSLRQKAFLAIRGHFASTAIGGSEDATYPLSKAALTAHKGGKISWNPQDEGYTAANAGTGAYFRQGPDEHGFDTLNFMPEGGASRCIYGTISGDGTNGFNGDEPPAGGLGTEIFPAGSERFFARDWFYSFAYCDFDSDGVYWTFTTSHVLSDISSGEGSNWGE